MSNTKTKQFHVGTWPLKSTGSTDEYETDDYSPSDSSNSSSSDDDDARAKSRRRAATPATTSRNRGKNGSGGTTKKGSSSNGGNSSARSNGTTAKRSNVAAKSSSSSSRGNKSSRAKDGEIELPSSDDNGDGDDDSYEGDSETGNKTSGKKKKSAVAAAAAAKNNSNTSRSTRSSRGATTIPKRNNELEDSDDDYETDNDNDDGELSSTRFGGKRGGERRNALGKLTDNGRNSARSSATSSSSSNNDSDSDESASIASDNDDSDDSDDDPFANLSRFPSNKRRKLQQQRIDSDDSDDSELSMDLGRSRNAALAKRRKKINNRGYSSSDSSEDSSDDGSSHGGKRKKKKAARKKAPPAKKVNAAAAAAAAKKNKSDNSDSDSSISFVGTASRRNPKRECSPQEKKPARKSPGRTALAASSSSAANSCELLLSSDDCKPSALPTTRRRSPRKSPSAASASRKPPPETLEHDPSVRAKSRLALEESRKARAALKIAQDYKAKEVELPELPRKPSPKNPYAARTGGAMGGGARGAGRGVVPTMEIVDIDSDNDCLVGGPPSAPPAPVYNGPQIRLTLRYLNPTTSKDAKTNIRINIDQPLQHLVDEFNSTKAGLEISIAKFDGDNLNLTKTPTFYDMEDEDLVDVVVKPVSVASRAGKSIRNAVGAILGAAARSPSGGDTSMTTIHVRAQAKPLQSFKIKRNDPLSKLINAYCKQYSLASLRLEYNGRVLDANKSPVVEGLPTVVHLDAIVPLGGGGMGGGSADVGGGVGAAAVGGKPMQLKFRVNGKSTDVVTLSLPFKGQFSSVMERFATKRNVSLNQCKFVFDGEELRSSFTPEGLDLEGGEIIDVKLTLTEGSSTAAASGTTARGGTASRDQSSTSASSISGRARASGSSSTAPPAKISIQTNRNLNKMPRQKTWKLTNTDPLSKLQMEYLKYYKSKGCKAVKFYFKNELVSHNLTKTLRDLGVGDTDVVYAMENGKAYVPV